jgi:TfoX/Sxy family transcriptional regulator of competence genes
MAYDEGLAERVRDALADEGGLVEKRMFGGLCFMVAGKMCVGIVKDELMVRVGPERSAVALSEPSARPMDFTSRPMKGFVYVSPEGFEADEKLAWWVAQAVDFARSAPAAPKRSRKAPARKLTPRVAKRGRRTSRKR